jgi:phosphopantetheinyl transferase
MINWIESIPEWNRALPATLIATGVTPEQRQALAHALVVRALNLHPEAVVIEQVKGRPPVVAKPMGSRLYLSLSHRDKLTAVAIASSPVGVDVEVMDIEAEIPWNVLHAKDAANLTPHEGKARASAFARLWSLKEAYLKSLGVGLNREPSSFGVSFVDGENAVIHDPVGHTPVAAARTTWRVLSGTWGAVSTVILEPQRHG